MIEVDCRKCKNCNSNKCIAYNTDNPDVAIKKCADDNFTEKNDGENNL